MKHAVLIGSIVLAGATSAQIAPNIGAETNGLSTVLRGAARTYQVFYAPSTISVGAPVFLTGLQFRLSTQGNEAIAATWPSQILSFSSYSIEISKASAQLLTDGEYLLSTTSFDFGHDAASRMTVRSGALFLLTAAFAKDGAGGANSFGAVINFQTNYLFNPGDSLVMTIRHTGYSPTSEPQPFFANGDYQAGITDAISSTAGATATNASGFSSPMITQFTTEPVPEPASMLALGAGAFLAARKRRK